MKKLIFFSCLLFTFPLLSQNVAPATITTFGSSTVYVEPDEALISITITNRSQEIKEARADNASESKKVIQYLKSKNIAARHIQTKYASISQKRQKRSQTVLEFTATQKINVCVKDLKALDDIMDGLFELEIAGVGTPIFRHTNINKYKKQARLKAIKVAQQKAKDLAAEINESIGNAYQIKEIQYTPTNRLGGYSDFSETPIESDDDDGSFAPGQLEVRASLEASFYLQ